MTILNLVEDYVESQDMGRTYHLGIDPGWKNLGIAVVSKDKVTEEIRKEFSKVYNPSNYRSNSEFIYAMVSEMLPYTVMLQSVTIERFVAYAGVSTSETENICMLIGALAHYYEDTYRFKPVLLRAIDWKIPLVKALHTKKGFNNPSPSLDKKFSDAAAIACLDEPATFATNHESDAVCLACFESYVGVFK